jgi:hypothetical protein
MIRGITIMSKIIIEIDPKNKQTDAVLQITVDSYSYKELHLQLQERCDTLMQTTREDVYFYKAGNTWIERHLDLAALWQKRWLKGNI